MRLYRLSIDVYVQVQDTETMEVDIYTAIEKATHDIDFLLSDYPVNVEVVIGPLENWWNRVKQLPCWVYEAFDEAEILKLEPKKP